MCWGLVVLKGPVLEVAMLLEVASVAAGRGRVKAAAAERAGAVGLVVALVEMMATKVEVEGPTVSQAATMKRKIAMKKLMKKGCHLPALTAYPLMPAGQQGAAVQQGQQH
jgi:hypothetical protein